MPLPNISYEVASMGLKKRFFASFSIRIIALMDNSSVGAI